MIEVAHQQITELINTFKQNENHYLSNNYSEAEARKDFIDKFFTILGWDVDHHFQKNPFQQEVKVEKAQRQQGSSSQKRADYAFAIAPDYKKTQFFVEAKKPSRLLRQNKEDYFQTAKYGWNSQTGISILTDFQEFIIIDCRYKPDFDTILKNEIKYYQYTDFLDLEKFEEIYWIFSHEALLAGNLTTFIENLPKPKGKDKQLKLFAGKYQSIDESFLSYIDDIRLQMAQAFYANNQNLDNYQLTEATQRTIDRLVFMRFLEDKQIEPEDLLHSISNATHSWQKFIETSKRLDAKYNGVVFKEHFIDKKGFLGADEFLFKNITTELDHTNTPYDFNYIPIHILGNIYERFLGKIITIENNKANIELKPEVRKAGGVFYTPKYIVDYIVTNTIGKLIENKKPKEIAKLTFADIACGSGSFLIGVFDYLLEYHKKYYNQNHEDAKKDGCIYDKEDEIYVLSIKQKQNILTNNVFGVDIDLQATEVTQVSLFLKLLEDETMTTANDMQVLFAEKILPDLSGNIKCGNSLIGTEILFDKFDFGKEELRKLNPFDFETAFPKIFRNGGFDAVVGNPPYVSSSVINLKNKDYFVKKFKVSVQRQYDLYEIFIEKSINILKINGLLSYITPRFYQYNLSSLTTRELLLNNGINRLTEVGKVFEDANTECSVLFLNKTFNNKVIDVFNYFPNKFLKYSHSNNYIFFEKLPSKIFNTIITNKDSNLINKINESSIKIFEISKVKRGIEVGKEKIKNSKNGKPILIGYDVLNYVINYDNTYLILNDLEKAKLSIFKNKNKILIRRVAKKLIATIDNYNYNFNKNLYGLISNINLNFILGIINSNVINFYFKKYFTTKKEDLFPEIQKYQIDLLPIPKITRENQSQHDELVKLVEQMLQAKKQEQTATTEHEKNLYKNLTESLDFKINNLVYRLYNLTKEEIELVEKE